MKKIFSLNAMSRIIFLLLTPIFFQYFCVGFIWHSIYWGAITMVVIIWSLFILISPLVGRVGCGWFCFMGTAADLSSQHAIFKTKWKRPKVWVRALILITFFTSTIAFYFVNTERGITHGFAVIPALLKLDFGSHYKQVWAIDVMSAIILGLLLDRRWACKNICFMGALCSAGASYSRLIPVVDTSKCTLCGKCEKDCLVRIPMLHYIQNNRGLITNSECILCGKCTEVCKADAIKIRFVWNRKKFKNETICQYDNETMCEFENVKI